jgi:predicted amidohydrolase
MILAGKIAVLQMTSGIDPAANRATMVDAVASAAAGGATMLFTPEVSGLVDRNRERAAPNLFGEADDPVLAAIRAAAADHGIWVHIGSLLIRRDDGKLANRGFVIDAAGEIRARYDKLHMFDVDLPTGESWRESASYTPGEGAIVVTTPVGCLGMS